jgi:hypothetical protein
MSGIAIRNGLCCLAGVSENRSPALLFINQLLNERMTERKMIE